MSLAPVILAGGASSRLGEPKALVNIGGLRVLERMLKAISDGIDGPAPVPLVVTGAHHGPIMEFLSASSLDVEVVENTGWSAGRTSSVQAAALRRPARDLLLWPADVPLVPPRVLSFMGAQWRALGAPPMGWLAPSFEDHGQPQGVQPVPRYGHPIVIGKALAGRVHAMLPDEPLRSLRASADPLRAVPVEEASVLDDLDTAADLARLRDRVARAQL